MSSVVFPSQGLVAWTFGSTWLLVACGCNGDPAAVKGDTEIKTQANKVDSAETVEESYRTAISQRGYVEDSQCRDCHSDLFDSYQSVGMARSFYPADGADVVEDFENSHYFHARSKQHFEMELRDGEFHQVRYQLDASGNRLNELSVKADYILGSGNHIRSYLYQTDAGELFQMPLAWYSQSGEWKLNPGYDRAEHEGFQRKITRECLFCHNAYPTDANAVDDRHWQPAVFDQDLPHGIGCQRCHGPGAEHIRQADSPASSEADILNSVVNPGNLSPQLAEDVCNQCHLQPSTQVLTQLVRGERGEFSFQPGQPLSEYRALLDYDEPSGEERFEINGHAYRMHESECYLQSDGELSCVTCHDPHRHIEAVEQVRHYRAACIQCHQVSECQPATEFEQPRDRRPGSVEAQSEVASASANSERLADCQDCHLPKRRTHDAIHAVMTDHRIGIYPAADSPEAREFLARRDEPMPPPPGTAVRDYKLAKTPHADAHEVEMHTSGTPESARVYRWIAEANLGNQNSLQSLVEYVRPMVELKSGTSRPEMLLPMLELSNALRLQGALEAEVSLLEQIVRLFPDHAQANLEYAMSLSAMGQAGIARRYYQNALKLQSTLPEAYMGMGLDALQSGRLDEAEKRMRQAIDLRPLYGDAVLNLGVVLYAKQDMDAASETFQRALAIEPSMREANEYLNQINAMR